MCRSAKCQQALILMGSNNLLKIHSNVLPILNTKQAQPQSLTQSDMYLAESVPRAIARVQSHLGLTRPGAGN